MELHVPYKLSFTVGGLFYREALKTVELYAELGDWAQVNQSIRSQNLLKARTQNSLERVTHELIRRMQALTPSEIEILKSGSVQEQQHILWLAACKQYRFVQEFAVEVLHEKFMRLNLSLAYPDFDAFFNAKAEWSPELEALTDSTRKKLRQVLFRILSEAGLLSAQGAILPVLLSPRLAQAIAADDPAYFQCFPLSDAARQ